MLNILICAVIVVKVVDSLLIRFGGVEVLG